MAHSGRRQRRARPPRVQQPPRPRSARAADGCACRRGAGVRSRDRRGRESRRSSAPARAGRGPRRRRRRGAPRAGAAAAATPDRRESPRPPRRANAAWQVRPCVGARSRRVDEPGPSAGASVRSAASSPTSPTRPCRGGIARDSSPPNVTTPSRLPRRVERCPIATATPSATSALRRSAVPNCIETDVSSTSQVTRTRSARSTRTCGSPVLAVTAQSMRRTSSPATYGRIIASSVPEPSRFERKSPARSPSTRRPIEMSSARSRPSAIGPGPGRAAVGRARSAPALPHAIVTRRSPARGRAVASVPRQGPGRGWSPT